MRGWGKVLGVTGTVAAAAVAALATGGVTWRRATGRSVTRLLAHAPAAGEARAPHPGGADPSRLPAPVARYFAFALSADQPGIRTARIRWIGEFQMRPGGGWKPFEAEQHVTAWRPGFVWDARIHMLPLVPVRVRDGYVAGEGSMLGRVGALATVVDQGGTPEMAAAALARWLGEAVWFPTALLPGAGPGEGVRWEAVDDRTARATITDGATTVSADFHFAPTGEITAMTAMRYCDVDGTGVLTPFEGRYWDYARRSGVMIPMSAEVAWLLPEGRFPYWRGHPADMVYDPRILPGGRRAGVEREPGVPGPARRRFQRTAGSVVALATRRRRAR